MQLLLAHGVYSEKVIVYVTLFISDWYSVGYVSIFQINAKTTARVRSAKRLFLSFASLLSENRRGTV